MVTIYTVTSISTIKKYLSYIYIYSINDIYILLL